MARKEELCSAQALQPPLGKLMMPMMMKASQSTIGVGHMEIIGQIK